MAASTVPLNYITLDEFGTARVSGTGIKVRILAEELLAGYQPDDIHKAHDELSMAQIHAALAYYYANKTSFDEAIKSGNAAVKNCGGGAGQAVSRKELVARLKNRLRGSVR